MTVQVHAGRVSLKKNALRRKLLNVALTSTEFQSTLVEAAAEIRSLAEPSATEATIEGGFERVMYAHLREIGLKFHPVKEQTVAFRRHVTRGRMDSRLGALVIEYKRPSLLRSQVQIEDALSQLERYVIALSEESDAPFIGLLTNGLAVVEVRACAGVITSTSGVEQLDANTLLRITRQFVSLALAALTPSNLVRDFCGSGESDGILFETARILYHILSSGIQRKTEMLFLEWEEMFRLAHDDQSQQRRIEERRAALASLFEIDIHDATDEYRALFALHTAYAIVLKFVAYRTVSDIHLGQPTRDYRSLTTTSDRALRSFCSELEDGEVFRVLGITNLLEGDFFSWYCDIQQWTPALADSIRSIAKTLARYEEIDQVFSERGAPDLFRDLYQAAVPRVVRSSFGEFYTPYWLADHVFEAARPTGEWRAIDPCCGSGTFVIAGITKVREECLRRGLDELQTLNQILSRVMAIDLNPLSVLTTRINYFIHISQLMPFQSTPAIVIPVFLSDAASIPDQVTIDGVDCITLELKTLKQPIKATLPTSLIQDTPLFMQVMIEFERHIKSQRLDAARRHLMDAVPPDDRSKGIQRVISELTHRLVELERRGWNGIWARILSNFVTTACLGRFTVVVGNPPWIDWKNLPAGYRERVKDLCLERGLFSGAGRTGGINLNICALIAYVSMTNWLDRNGRLAFLMPRELANQASYEGWRRLGGEWEFLRFDDWSNAGHPFDPVKEDFMTFIVRRRRGNSTRIPVQTFKKRQRNRNSAATWSSLTEAMSQLEVRKQVAGQIVPGSTAFTLARNNQELDRFSLVSGFCEYIGREGIEFYPQELMLFHYIEPGPKPGTVWLRNVQATKSKYRVQARRVLLETEFLHPLVKGPEIKPFDHLYSGLIVAFPYDEEDPSRPIAAQELHERSPLLLNYYMQSQEMLKLQTKFSDKIRGHDPGEFYGLARTGRYSFAQTYVGFRDNTNWCAVVVQDGVMPWGERKRFLFQNHAVSICERHGGGFIDYEEAHFVCAILNAPIVQRFISATSDDRSYKIRPPVFVPEYEPGDVRHKSLVTLSIEAHESPERRESICTKVEELYLSMCEEEAYDAMIATERIEAIENGTVRSVDGPTLRQRFDTLKT